MNLQIQDYPRTSPLYPLSWEERGNTARSPEFFRVLSVVKKELTPWPPLLRIYNFQLSPPCPRLGRE